MRVLRSCIRPAALDVGEREEEGSRGAESCRGVGGTTLPNAASSTKAGGVIGDALGLLEVAKVPGGLCRGVRDLRGEEAEQGDPEEEKEHDVDRDKEIDIGPRLSMVGHSYLGWSRRDELS